VVSHLAFSLLSHHACVASNSVHSPESLHKMDVMFTQIDKINRCLPAV
jgi:hypothetical protein